MEMLDKYLPYVADVLIDESARLKSEAEKAENKQPEYALELKQAADWLEKVAMRIATIEDVKDVEDIERIKEALANEAPNKDAEKAVKKPFGARTAFSRAFGGIRIQTHTQKHFDAQNNSWASAPFGEHGDLTALHVGRGDEKEAASSAGAAANGVVQIVKRIIEHEQHAGGVNKAVSKPDSLDKALLYPIYEQGSDKYVAVRPITPVWYLSSLYHAARKASAKKLADALNARKAEWIAQDKKKMPDAPRIFSRSIRVRCIANPVNNGPMLKAIKGYVIQSILLPPKGGKMLTEWIAKTWQDGEVGIESLLNRAVKQSINDADIINRIAHQMHRLHGKEIRGVDAPENAGVRQVWFDAGSLCATGITSLIASVDLSIIKDEEKRKGIEEKLDKQLDDWRKLRDRAWNVFVGQMEEKLTLRWKTLDWKEQFYKGFEAGIYGHGDNAVKTVQKGHRLSGRNRKSSQEAGHRLRIWLDVEAMDAGSFAPTLGIVPLTSVWGALHKWIERDGNNTVAMFKVGVRNLRLLDHISGSPVFVKDLGGKAMKTLFEKEDEINAEDVIDYVRGPNINCIITQKSHTGRKPDKVEEPLMGEVRMSAQVLIETEVGDVVDLQALEHVRQSIDRSRFNGGFIRDFKVEIVDKEKPVYDWYALSVTDVPDGNPLETMFYRLIHSNVRLENEPPFGFVQTGWQFLDVPESHTIYRNGETFEWKASEPVWQAVRWVGWNNPDAVWWRFDELEFETDGRAIGVAPH